MSYKKIIFILFVGTISFGSVALSQQRDTVRILFIGNSYTYENDMPSLLREMAKAANRPLYVDESTVGGFSLEQHAGYGVTIDKIMERRWDFVVLQEQSMIPAIPYYRDNSMYPAARKLDAMIKSVGGKTIFFLTWGRRVGGQQTIGAYSSPPFKDFFQMQDSLTTAYRRIAVELSAGLCPIGLAWKLAFRADPNAALWQMDNSHPASEGAYLSACVMFATVLGSSPEGNTYLAPNVDALLLPYYQKLAYHALQVYGTPISAFKLWQNFPNPCTQTTTFTFSIPESGFVTMKLYNTRGQEVAKVASGSMEAGIYDVFFDARSLSSGAYFAQLQFGLQAATNRMTIIK
jgi:hypothetical protein